MKILLVTRNFYRLKDLENLCPDDEVRGCFRDYHLKSAIKEVSPDLIISDGKCKTRDEYGQSVSIYFDPRPTARQHNIPVSSWSWFMLKARIANFFSRKAQLSS